MTWHHVNKPTFDPGLLEPMQQLWEQAPHLSAARIAEGFNVTKNTVIGQARRRNWKPRRVTGPEPTTTLQRLDAIKAKMDALLAETRPYVEGRKKVVIADAELVGLEAAE
jgi:hypothetical protein